MTPEGRVKAKVRRLLGEYAGLWVHWPVPSGFGRTALDCLGCYRGRFFAIETKPEKGKPTLRQTGEIERIERAMGTTFVIAGVESPVFDELRAWLDEQSETIDDDPHFSQDQVRRRPI